MGHPDRCANRLAATGTCRGIALGHARLSNRTEGDRAPVNGELIAALTQLIKQDYGAFVRYGIAQATQGSISEEHAKEMLERFPKELMALGWERVTGDTESVEGVSTRCLGRAPAGVPTTRTTSRGARATAGGAAWLGLGGEGKSRESLRPIWARRGLPGPRRTSCRI
jgi:hypothetical protein